MKRNYRKLNYRYWNGDHYPWRWVVILMAIFVAWAMVNKAVNKGPLVSPLVANPVKQVYAEFISCENPKGYLECQAYQGVITWEEHDRMYKIIECESKWNPEAINTKNSNGSWDAGLAQINSVHKNISNADKFDYKKSIDWMIKKYKADKSFNAWTCNRLVK
jgi:hypothetical protein